MFFKIDTKLNPYFLKEPLVAKNFPLNQPLLF